MGEQDWLVRRITWLAAHIFRFHDGDLSDDKNRDQDYDNVYEFGLDQFGYKKIEAGGLVAVVRAESGQQAARIAHRTAFLYLGELVEEGETTAMFSTPRERLTEEYITGRFG